MSLYFDIFWIFVLAVYGGWIFADYFPDKWR